MSILRLAIREWTGKVEAFLSLWKTDRMPRQVRREVDSPQKSMGMKEQEAKKWWALKSQANVGGPSVLLGDSVPGPCPESPMRGS